MAGCRGFRYGNVTIDGRAAALGSESERWRAQTAIQLTAAAIAGSKAVVLDRGDILDREGRKGLWQILDRFTTNAGIAVLLCSTDPYDHDGNAFWPVIRVENGVTQ